MTHSSPLFATYDAILMVFHHFIKTERVFEKGPLFGLCGGIRLHILSLPFSLPTTSCAGRAQKKSSPREKRAGKLFAGIL
jgi:hypothetical protein